MLDVKARIAESGLSIDEIAKKAAIGQVRLDAILAGEDFSLAELMSLASALGITPSDFLSRPDQQKKVGLLFRRSIRRKSAAGFIGAADRLASQVASSFYLAPNLLGNLKWLNEFQINEQTHDVAEFNAERFRAIFYKGDLVSPILGLPKIGADELSVRRAPEVRQAAEDCLRFLVMREEEHRLRTTLLRPIGYDPTDSRALLRPATVDIDCDTSLLLRSAEGDQQV